MSACNETTASGVRSALPENKSLVFVGLMSVGKSTVGRRVAHLLDLPFCDSDAEIEAAAGRTVPEIFGDFGEAAFRDGERRVIKRLLEGERLVLATGGGAFMDPVTRGTIAGHAISIWLDADIEVLVERASRNDSRPLLAGVDPRAKLTALAQERSPLYAHADLKVTTDGFSLNESCDAVLHALKSYLNQPPGTPA